VIVPYTAMPFGDAPRPLLDVAVEGAGFAVKALVDTGAVNTLFDRWVADEVGVDLTEAATRTLGVGGGEAVAHFVEVRLTVGDHTWEAEVGFCDEWPAGWGLLGHTGFLRYFTLTVRASDLEFELDPNPV
jgi:predicted aspartyl protease